MTLKVTRSGKGYHWSEEAHAPGGTRSVSGYTIDNLDTKTLDETTSIYEEAFVRIRTLLASKPWCCDNKEDVLFICQAVSDELRENLLLRRNTR
tara:strand:- start:172 stop:453 length:282 start_codon:yes stop_codon:yes gene_type:complete